jgi:hypothetical protein
MIQPVIDSAATLGVPVELMFPIGILELLSAGCVSCCVSQ